MDKEALGLNELFSGHLLRIGGSWNQSFSHLEAPPVLLVSTTERWCGGGGRCCSQSGHTAHGTQFQ